MFCIPWIFGRRSAPKRDGREDSVDVKDVEDPSKWEPAKLKQMMYENDDPEEFDEPPPPFDPVPLGSLPTFEHNLEAPDTLYQPPYQPPYQPDFQIVCPRAKHVGWSSACDRMPLDCSLGLPATGPNRRGPPPVPYSTQPCSSPESLYPPQLPDSPTRVPSPSIDAPFPPTYVAYPSHEVHPEFPCKALDFALGESMTPKVLYPRCMGLRDRLEAKGEQAQYLNSIQYGDQVNRGLDELDRFREARMKELSDKSGMSVEDIEKGSQKSLGAFKVDEWDFDEADEWSFEDEGLDSDGGM